MHTYKYTYIHTYINTHTHTHISLSPLLSICLSLSLSLSHQQPSKPTPFLIPSNSSQPYPRPLQSTSPTSFKHHLVVSASNDPGLP